MLPINWKKKHHSNIFSLLFFWDQWKTLIAFQEFVKYNERTLIWDELGLKVFFPFLKGQTLKLIDAAGTAKSISPLE
jgi:hypothetical protein